MTNFDRRQQPRIDWAGDAIAAFGSREVHLRARDLSVGGFGVETPWCPALGDRVGVVLHIEGQPIGAWAEVAWAAPASDRYVWGLRFLDLEQQGRARLEAFVDRCLAVDMLEEMLAAAQQGDAVEAAEAPPAFALDDLEDNPTRVFGRDELRGDPVSFFPSGGNAALEGEATAEIEVESTLTTAEAPRTETVRVDIQQMFAHAVQGEQVPSPSHPPVQEGAWQADAGQSNGGWPTQWLPTPPPDDIEWDAPAAVEPAPFEVEPLTAAPLTAPSPTAPRRPTPARPAAAPMAIEVLADHPDATGPATRQTAPAPAPRHATPAPAPRHATPAPAAPRRATPAPALTLEPLAGDPFVGGAMPEAGDPFFVAEPAAVAFPGHAPAPWPAPATGAVQPRYDAQHYDAQAQAKAAYDAQQQACLAQQQAHAAQQRAYAEQLAAQAAAAHAAVAAPTAAYDPHAFDPQAFDPQAFGAPTLETRPAAPVAAPAPLEPPAAPLSPDELLELKRQRVAQMLSSVPRRTGPNATVPAANATKADDSKGAKKRRKPADPDTGLRRLFDEAVRDISGDE